MADLAPCGTRAAYERHRRRNEEPCRACKDASAAYQRNRSAGRAYGRARARAMTRLAQRYSTAYAQLLAEELAKEKTR